MVYGRIGFVFLVYAYVNYVTSVCVCGGGGPIAVIILTNWKHLGNDSYQISRDFGFQQARRIS